MVFEAAYLAAGATITPIPTYTIILFDKAMKFVDA